MKILFYAYAIGSVITLNAQTTVYRINEEGTADNRSYLKMLNGSGVVLRHDQSSAFVDDTVKLFVLKIEGNKVNGELRKGMGPDMKLVFGYLNEETNIMRSTTDKSGGTELAGHLRGEDIYDLQKRKVAHIEGDKMEGVALFLTMN